MRRLETIVTMIFWFSLLLFQHLRANDVVVAEYNTPDGTKCRCMNSSANDVNLKCKRISPQELEQSLNHFRHHGHRINALTISHVYLPRVTAGLLKGLEIKTLILDNTRMHNFSNTLPGELLSSLENLEIRENFAGSSNSNTFKSVQQLGIPRFIKLQSLFLMTRNLESLSDNDFAHLPTLQKLGVKSRELKEIKNGVFAGLANLKELSLDSHKNILIQKAMFTPLKHLEKLYLSVNKLKLDPKVFTDVGQLKSLETHLSEMENLPAGVFLPTTGLTNLSATFNKLSELKDVLTLPNLRALDLTYNDLSEIDSQTFAHTPNVKYVKLTFNKIQQIDDHAFDLTPSLEQLDLSYNKIKELKVGTFGKLANLTSLNVKDNAITNLSPTIFKNNLRLAHVKLSTNQITNLPADLFANQKSSLTCLELNFMNIEQIPSGFLREHDRLETLAVRSNSLKTIDPMELRKSEKSLKQLWISDNPFNCDCDMVKFLDWYNIWYNGLSIEERGVQDREMRDAKCAGPVNHVGKLITSLDVSKLRSTCPHKSVEFLPAIEGERKRPHYSELLANFYETIRSKIIILAATITCLFLFIMIMCIAKRQFLTIKLESKLKSLNHPVLLGVSHIQKVRY